MTDNVPAQPQTITRAEIARLVNTKQYAKVEPILLRVLIQDPQLVWALTALGIVYRSTKKFEAAEACYRRAIHLEPDEAEVYSNYGNLLIDMDKMDEAVAASEKAVELAPDTYLYHKNLAVTYRETKHFDKSLAQYLWCLERRPDDADLLFDIAYVSLYLLDFEKAWEYFEWRFKTKKLNFPPAFTIPAWKGESLAGRRILVMAEQGFGDTILMTRFIPVLAGMGARVTLSCKPPLHRLFSSLPCTLVSEAIRSEHDYDTYIAMMSIPRLLEKDWRDWPAPATMHVAPQARQKFSFLQHHAGGKLKVGIIWSGSVTFAGNDKRAVELDRFLQLAAKHPRVQFYSFQKGEREKDFQTFGMAPIVPLGQMFEDFSETAAALEQMDLIVMTDSSVSHLAGCLDVPVLNLLQFMPYWLYFPEEPTTPLYSSVRFIRQEKSGDWDLLFRRASDILSVLEQERQEKTLSRERVLNVIDAEQETYAQNGASTLPASPPAPVPAPKADQSTGRKTGPKTGERRAARKKPK